MSTLLVDTAGQVEAAVANQSRKVGKFLPGVGVYGFDDFEVAI